MLAVINRSINLGSLVGRRPACRIRLGFAVRLSLGICRAAVWPLCAGALLLGHVSLDGKVGGYIGCIEDEVVGG
jgi:hypothetical protein